MICLEVYHSLHNQLHKSNLLQVVLILSLISLEVVQLLNQLLKHSQLWIQILLVISLAQDLRNLWLSQLQTQWPIFSEFLQLCQLNNLQPIYLEHLYLHLLKFRPKTSIKMPTWQLIALSRVVHNLESTISSLFSPTIRWPNFQQWPFKSLYRNIWEWIFKVSLRQLLRPVPANKLPKTWT